MPPSALLDTNVWVSAFLKPDGLPGRIVAAAFRGEFASVAQFLKRLSRQRNR